jgi:hypothetical protein
MSNVILKVLLMYLLTFIIGFIVAFIIKGLTFILKFSDNKQKRVPLYPGEYRRLKNIRRIRMHRILNEINNSSEIVNHYYEDIKNDAPINIDSNELIEYYYGKE